MSRFGSPTYRPAHHGPSGLDAAPDRPRRRDVSPRPSEGRVHEPGVGEPIHASQVSPSTSARGRTARRSSGDRPAVQHAALLCRTMGAGAALSHRMTLPTPAAQTHASPRRRARSRAAEYRPRRAPTPTARAPTPTGLLVTARLGSVHLRRAPIPHWDSRPRHQGCANDGDSPARNQHISRLRWPTCWWRWGSRHSQASRLP